VADLREGQSILDEYVVEKELGHGGMGRVWLVKNRLTSRRYAVKQALLKDDKHRKAFLAELQIWIDLPEHPNLAPCRFFRTVGDEIIIFADYIEGGSLADWIAKGKLTGLEQILDVAIQFAWGLHAIHERGLVHQDVKPDNVLMTIDGVPMITDFGLAWARMRVGDRTGASSALSGNPPSTLVSSGGMTPAYASPEQRNGGALSRKTDIWSWGVSILDMFMGGVSCPHGGHIAADVLDAFLENGRQDDYLPAMPTEVSAVLETCFKRAPEDRWSNLGEVIELLKEAYSLHTGCEYARELYIPHPQTSVSRDYSRNRSYYGAQWHDPRGWIAQANEELELNTTSIDSSFIASGNRKGSGVNDLALYEKAVRLYQKAVADGIKDAPKALALIYIDKAHLHYSLDDFSGAISSYDQSLLLCAQLSEQAVSQEINEAMATALSGKAGILHVQGSLQESATFQQQAIEIFRRRVESIGDQDARMSLGSAYMNLALTIGNMGDLQGAVSLYDKCISIMSSIVDRARWRALADPAAHELALAYMNKATALGGMSDPRCAASLCDKSITIWRRMVEQDGYRDMAHHLALALMNKSAFLQRIGEQSQADACSSEGQLILRSLVEEDGRSEFTADLATSHISRASGFVRMGDALSATEMGASGTIALRKMVEMEGRQDLAERLAASLGNEAMSLIQTGRMDDALKAIDECVDIYSHLVEQNKQWRLAPELAMSLARKAMVAEDVHGVSYALQIYDQSIGIYKHLIEKDGRTDQADAYADMLVNKANSCLGAGDEAGAMDIYDQCIGMYQQLIKRGRKQSSRTLAEMIMLKSIAFWRVGEPTQAVKLIEESIGIYQKLGGDNREDFIGDLAAAEVMRGIVLSQMGQLSRREIRCIRTAFETLSNEIQRTCNITLMQIWEIANMVLPDILS